MINIKSRFVFQLSPWFETLFALELATDPESRIHSSWKNGVLLRLPQTFHKKFRQIGGSHNLWPVILDTLLDVPVAGPFEEMVAKFEAVAIQHLKKKIFLGIFHEPGPVKKMLSGDHDLYQTITRLSKTKREWLAFLGLYPPGKNSPLLKGLEFLMRSPAEFQQIVVQILDLFWRKEFSQTWSAIQPKLERSKEEKERLFQSCSLEEFARLARLRIEVDQKAGLLKAVRGGYSLRLNQISKAFVLPSAFNDKRHWTSNDENPNSILAYFPYFDPAISLTWVPAGGDVDSLEPELDPALIFKALGDATRYAMVSLLAKDAQTSAELSRILGLSRPTVSHHIHLLREAGLLQEKAQGNTVLLSLNRVVFENISELVTKKLFQDVKEIELTKTRKK